MIVIVLVSRVEKILKANTLNIYAIVISLKRKIQKNLRTNLRKEVENRKGYKLIHLSIYFSIHLLSINLFNLSIHLFI